MNLSRPLVLTTMLIGVSVQALGGSRGETRIVWSQSEIVATIGDGKTGTNFMTVAFSSTGPLDDVSVFVTPSLNDFLVVSPIAVGSLKQDQPYALTMSFFLPPHA